MQYFSAPLEAETLILLGTDGFWRLNDTYHVYGMDQLVDAALNGGLERLARELREIERNDRQCVKFPRIKPTDDATALLCRIRIEGV